MARVDAVLTDTPVGLWREADGVDHSGDDLDLTPFGGPTVETGLDGSDPADASIGVVDGSNLWNPTFYSEFELTQFSLSFLMNAETVGDVNRDVVAKTGLYGVFLGTDSKLHAFALVSSVLHEVVGATTIVENTTYDVGVSYASASGTLRLSVDGIEDGSAVFGAGGIDNTPTASFTVGTSGAPGFDGFDGRLDEVALFGTVIGQDRFLAYFNAGLGPILWVDADHVAADDAGDRTDAQDPDTPLESIIRACEVALEGDRIRVLPALNADPGNTADTAMYEAVISGMYAQSAFITEAGVTIEGIAVDDVRPKWLGLHASDLDSWTIRGFQIGYDLDSGDEYSTNVGMIGPTDFRCEDCVFTGGAYSILAPQGVNVFEGCTITARLSEEPASAIEGNGFRIAPYVGYTLSPADLVEWHNCTFLDVEGEDAIQGVTGSGSAGLIVEDCTFEDVQQSGEAHSDAIQTTGASLLRVARCTFRDVDSMIIQSDGTLDRLELENNLFVGPGGFSTQFSGVVSALIRHNTWVTSGFAALRFYEQGGNLPETYEIELHSNVIDHLQINIPDSGAGVTWLQHDNLIGIGPATVDDTVGFAEYGTSVDTDYELANDPDPNPGIDIGWDEDPDPLLLDRLGRAREGAAPDCGCHESSLSQPVTAGARPPILIAFTPAGGALTVDRDTDVTVELFPKPGETIDETTVTESSFFVEDAAGFELPVVGITVGEPDEDGHQLLTLDIDGTMYPRVGFQTTITTAIEDTEGSALATENTASWRTIGPAGPAVGDLVAGGWTVGTI